MPNPIGFNAPPPVEVKKTYAAITDLDDQFQRMVKDLGFQDEALERQLSIDKDLREALVRLHGEILKVRERVDAYNSIIAKFNAIEGSQPIQAAKLLYELEELEGEFAPFYHELMKDIQAHIIPDLDAMADILRNRVLTGNALAHYRETGLALQSLLNLIGGPVMNAINGRFTDNARRALVMKYPDLR